MSIDTELCWATGDEETLHGLLYRPHDDGAASDLAVLLIPGVGGNFYSSVPSSVEQALAERGYHAATMNTRGHDWISTSSREHRFRGATDENLEDCAADLCGL